MKSRKILSSKYNMSLGLLPAIATMILCEFICQERAIYIGTTLAVIQLYIYYGRRAKNVNFILDITTLVLFALTISTFFYKNYCPIGLASITIEASIIIPLFIIYLHKKRFISFLIRKKKEKDRQQFAQGAEASIVSTRVLFILGAIHFIVLTIFFLTGKGIEPHTHWIMFRLFPILVFSLSILFNQVAINYFNKIIAHTEYYPIVNKYGDVIGKSTKEEIVNNKKQNIYPLIRIAIIADNELLLCKRPQKVLIEKEKIDVPIEGFLRYNETISQGIQRLLDENLTKVNTGVQPIYHLTYHFKTQETNRLIYSFSIEMDKEEVKNCFKRRDAKFWNLNSIKEKIQTSFFSALLREEFEYLSQVIYTREKHKEL